MSTVVTWVQLSHEYSCHTSTVVTGVQLSHEYSCHTSTVVTRVQLSQEYSCHMSTVVTWVQLSHEYSCHTSTVVTWVQLPHEYSCHMSTVVTWVQFVTWVQLSHEYSWISFLWTQSKLESKSIWLFDVLVVERIILSRSVRNIIIKILSFSVDTFRNKNIDHQYIFLLRDSTMSSTHNFCFLSILL